jgi:hypothetical protein
MSKFKIESILVEVSTQVFSCTNLNEGKNIIISLLERKNINEVDKKIILHTLSNIKNLSKLQSYVCNSLLKYEGLGVV